MTGISSYGVFVGFYAGLKGLAPLGELGLTDGQKAGDCFQVGSECVDVHD